jgi:hypothetical protein
MPQESHQDMSNLKQDNPQHEKSNDAYGIRNMYAARYNWHVYLLASLLFIL